MHEPCEHMSMFSTHALRLGLFLLGAIVACPVQAQTPALTRAGAAAVLATELLKLDKNTEITILDDKTTHVRGFHALDEMSGDDIWDVFVWLEDDCMIRSSTTRSWVDPAERRLEVRLGLLKEEEAYYGQGRAVTWAGNGREAPVCMQIPAKPSRCRTFATSQHCRRAAPADMFCLQNLRIDNPFSREDALDQVVRALAMLRHGCSARHAPSEGEPRVKQRVTELADERF
jgi:hypothetical protein